MKIPISTEDLKLLSDKVRRLNPPVDPSTVEWYWNTGMSLNNGNMGRYYGILNQMHLPFDSRTIAMSQNEMLPTICHELWHAHQRNTLGLFTYKILAFPILANYTIEPSARAEARRVELLLHLQGQNTGEQAGD